MFPIEAFQTTLHKFTTILRERQIRFHLTGGVTSVAYAEPRMTQDIDIVVDNVALSKNLSEILNALLKSDFMFDEEAARAAVQSRKMFRLLDIGESLKLDIYPRELIEGELSRSGEIELFEGVFYPIASRVDTAIAKLLWVEQGSYKSRRDLRHLYFNASETEQGKINRLVSDLDKQALLQDILAESNEIDL